MLNGADCATPDHRMSARPRRFWRGLVGDRGPTQAEVARDLADVAAPLIAQEVEQLQAHRVAKGDEEPGDILELGEVVRGWWHGSPREYVNRSKLTNV